MLESNKSQPKPPIGMTIPNFTMPENKNESFLNFLKIFAETGNPKHAALESGWEDLTTDQPSPEVNLSTILKDKHHLYLHYDVTMPPAIKKYIKSTDEKLTQNEIDNLEIGMEKYHKIDAQKHCIIFSVDDNSFHLIKNCD